MPDRHVKFVFREFPASVGEEEVKAAVSAAGLTALYSRFDHLLHVFYLAFPMPLDAAIDSAQKLGAELGANVEVALLQKLHRPRSNRRDQRQGTIEDSAHYREFVQRCERLEDGSGAGDGGAAPDHQQQQQQQQPPAAPDADVRAVAPIISFLSRRKFASNSGKKGLSSAKMQAKRAKALAKRQKKELAKAARKAAHKDAAASPSPSPSSSQSTVQSKQSPDAADASVAASAAGKTPFKIMQRTVPANSSNSAKLQDTVSATGKRSGRSKKAGRKDVVRSGNRGGGAVGVKSGLQKEAWTR